MKKIILVTGASSGIGRACANYLASKGHVVYGTSRKLIAENLPYQIISMDVTNRSSIDSAIQCIIEKEGRIDVVVNNAGMGISGAIEDCSAEEIKLQFDTNFLGTLNVCQSVIPHMRKAGSGTIINISSLGGLMGLPFQGMYSATKYAIEGMSEALRHELRAFGIKVVLVNPGDFATGFTDNRRITPKAQLDGPYREQFLRSIAQIEKDERGGSNPIKIARGIEKIIQKKSPKMRYLIGGFEQILFAKAKSILPSKFFLWVLGDHYKIK